MDDTPFANDGADTSLRKTVSLLNKIEAKTGSTTITGPVTVNNEVEVTNSIGNPIPVSGTITTIPRSGATSKSAKQGLLQSGSDQVFQANSARKYLLVQNISPSTDIYLGIGYVPATAPVPISIPSIDGNSGNGILLPKKGGGIIFEGSYIPTAAIYLAADVNNASSANPYATWIAIEA